MSGSAGRQLAEAISEFETSHFMPVALIMSSSADAAHEALGIAYAKALARWQQFNPSRGGVRNWMLAIISHTIIDQARAVKRSRTTSLDAIKDASGDVGGYWRDDDIGPERMALMREQARTISRAVAALPISFRAAVRMVWMRGLRGVDAASVLGCPVGTVKSRLHRSRARLRRALSEYQNGGKRWNR